MSSQSRPPEQPAPKSWLKRNGFSLFLFLMVVALTLGLFFLQDKLEELGNLGYLSAFLLGLVANATIILPMPAMLMVVPMGATFNPLYIGMAAGIGAAIGEMSSYLAGYSGRGIWHDNKNYQKAVMWLKKWGAPIVFFFAATPMPIDVMGIAGGNLRFPAWKYFLACWAGKTVKYTVMALAGKYGWEAFINSPSSRMAVTASLVAIAVTLVLLGLALFLESRGWKKTGSR